MRTTFDCDLAIVGTGPVACALVTALAQRGSTRQLRLALIGPQRAHVPIDTEDPRAIALSHGSRILLNSAWPTQATPIHRIQISQHRHFGRAIIDRKDCALPALGYVVRYSALLHALGNSAQAHIGTHLPGWLPMAAGLPIQDEQGITLPLTALTYNSSSPQTAPSSIRTRLLIYAEGNAPVLSATGPAPAPSSVAEHAPSSSIAHRYTHDYHQTALIGIVRVSAPQPYTAWERFTREGPLALLPLGGLNEADYALVWCSAPETAKRRLQAPPEQLLTELEAIFGGRMGAFLSITHRTTFPLTLQKQRTLASKRIAIIGNAAQMLHPVAGQGLNLGLRDAWTLAQSLRVGPTPEALTAFAKHRQPDREMTLRITHFLAKAFIPSTHFPTCLFPLSALHSANLLLLDHLSPLKKAFANQMIYGSR